jgi:FlaA1/EpsC-like NDP-sugar epimerase
LINSLINLSRLHKKLVMVFFDSVLIVSILLVSFSMRLGYFYFPESNLVWVILGAPIIAIPIFVRFGLYHAVIRYIGFKALWAIIQAVTLYALLWGVIVFMAAVEGIPRSVILINWLSLMVAIGGSRMIGRWLLSEVDNSANPSTITNVVIYGAGSAGRQLSIALTQSSEYNPVAFIDDNNEMNSQSINGINVISRDGLDSLIKQKNVTKVLLAIPTLSRKERKEVIHFLEPFPVLVLSLPSVSELAKGVISIGDLHEITIKDLLGRESVEANKGLLGKNICDKVVLITGAGGSIGSELCRQIASLKPKVLILYEISEVALYSIDKQLSNLNLHSISIYPILGSTNNKNRLTNVCKHFDVDTIYHAAAYKHVPMVEFNNSEGARNNIFGTLNCAQAAIDADVDTFVLISTDKAVRPTNTMGATKRIAELVLQALAAKQSDTKFSMVRFGNVLGSSGSVIPLFKQQIKDGGPLTVTDQNIIRYFMTIEEAVGLVIQAGAMGSGGDLFVLDMGEPVRIQDLAKKMIRLSGLEIKDKSNPDGDIEIKYTGLRSGEKLYEELLIGDNVTKTDNPLIMRAQEDMIAWHELKPMLDEIDEAIDSDNHEILRKLLIQIVPGFIPQCEISDILYKDK